jgi:hypothetical protein
MVFNATFNNISVISWQTINTDDYLIEVTTIEMNSITQPLAGADSGGGAPARAPTKIGKNMIFLA